MSTCNIVSGRIASLATLAAENRRSQKPECYYRCQQLSGSHLCFYLYRLWEFGICQRLFKQLGIVDCKLTRSLHRNYSEFKRTWDAASAKSRR